LVWLRVRLTVSALFLGVSAISAPPLVLAILTHALNESPSCQIEQERYLNEPGSVFLWKMSKLPHVFFFILAGYRHINVPCGGREGPDNYD